MEANIIHCQYFQFFFPNSQIFCCQADIQLKLWPSLRSMAVNDLFSIFYSVWCNSGASWTHWMIWLIYNQKLICIMRMKSDDVNCFCPAFDFMDVLVNFSPQWPNTDRNNVRNNGFTGECCFRVISPCSFASMCLGRASWQQECVLS